MSWLKWPHILLSKYWNRLVRSSYTTGRLNSWSAPVKKKTKANEGVSCFYFFYFLQLTFLKVHYVTFHLMPLWTKSRARWLRPDFLVTICPQSFCDGWCSRREQWLSYRPWHNVSFPDIPMSYTYRTTCQTRSVHCRAVLYHIKNTNCLKVLSCFCILLRTNSSSFSIAFKSIECSNTYQSTLLL